MTELQTLQTENVEAENDGLDDWLCEIYPRRVPGWLVIGTVEPVVPIHVHPESMVDPGGKWDFAQSVWVVDDRGIHKAVALERVQPTRETAEAVRDWRRMSGEWPADARDWAVSLAKKEDL